MLFGGHLGVINENQNQNQIALEALGKDRICGYEYSKTEQLLRFFYVFNNNSIVNLPINGGFLYRSKEN